MGSLFFWEQFANLVNNSIVALFIFIICIAQYIAINPDFGQWIIDKLEEFERRMNK